MSLKVPSFEAFEAALADVVTAHVPGCSALLKVERLSGGASQETYRLTVERDGIEMPLAMRRTPGGEYLEPLPAHPGLDLSLIHI